jgi:hypothetical protein
MNIPVLSEQLAVIKEFEKFETLENKLKILNMRIDRLFTKQIV